MPARRTSTRAAKPKIAFFFGAGAEVAYGMPAGGRFALEIFRRSFDGAKDIFRAQRAALDPAAYGDWLPENYLQRQVREFGKHEKGKVFEDTLKSSQAKIVSALDDFDRRAVRALHKLNISEATFRQQYQERFGKALGTETYAERVKFSDQLGTTKLFASSYFSAMLDLYDAEHSNLHLRRLTRSVVQLLSGALGQNLVKRLNSSIFAARPLEIDVFDIDEMFRIDAAAAGERAFLDVLAGVPVAAGADASLEFIASAILQLILEDVIEQSISYQDLMDEYYPSLFRPSVEWPKFSKVSIFLHAVRSYVLEEEQSALAGFANASGYYHDLGELIAERDVAVAGIGTSNYTSLIRRSAKLPKGAFHLNGQLDDYLDPFRNQIRPQREVAGARSFLVPLLFTQSGVKPMTSVLMSQRYVDYYRRMQEADLVVAVGFGFNGDDGHINGLFREAIDVDKKRTIVIAYDQGEPDVVAAARYRRQLRIDAVERLQVIQAGDDRKIGKTDWRQAIIDLAKTDP